MPSEILTILGLLEL